MSLSSLARFPISGTALLPSLEIIVIFEFEGRKSSHNTHTNELSVSQSVSQSISLSVCLSVSSKKQSEIEIRLHPSRRSGSYITSLDYNFRSNSYNIYIGEICPCLHCYKSIIVVSFFFSLGVSGY
jgi:hypothetical protein